MRFDLPESIHAMQRGQKKRTTRRSRYWLEKKPGSRITIVHDGKLLGRATVKGTRTQIPMEMTADDARDEGYDNIGQFFAAMNRLYPKEYFELMEQEMVVVEFWDIRWNGRRYE